MTTKHIAVNVTALARADKRYNRAAGAVIFTALLFAAIGPPTAYLVPVVVAAWGVLIWAIRRENRPRYKRTQ